MFCFIIVHVAIPLFYGFLSFVRLDAFLDETIDLWLFMRDKELGIIIALWHAVDLVKLLFDSLQFFNGQAMNNGAIKNPQLALEAPSNHIVGVGTRHLMLMPLLCCSIVLKLPVFI